MNNDIFAYYIDSDERGQFAADVRDSCGATVFEIRAGNSLEEGESSIFDDGFMKHKDDLDGLASYLKSLNVIPQQAKLLRSSAAEAAWDAEDADGSGTTPQRYAHAA